MIALRAALAVAAALVAGSFVLARAGAQEPPTGTPAVTPTPTVASMYASFPLSNDEPVIRWEPVTGATQYHLTATFRAVRINASNPCTATTHDKRTLTLDETLKGDTTEFRLPLPDLPPEDKWLIWENRTKLNALDPHGQIIAAAGGGGIAETNFMCPTATAPQVLPPTGSGGQGNAAPIAVLIGCLAAAAIGLCVALGTALRRGHAE